MFCPSTSIVQPYPPLPEPIIYHNVDHGWLWQPGTTTQAVLSLHTCKGLRVRLVSSPFIDLSGLPADNYLLRVQLPGGSVYVSRVSLG